MAREYKRPERLRDRLNPKYKGKKRPAPVNALLWIDDTPYRLLEVEYGFMHHTDGAGRAIGDLCLKPFIAVIKPIKDHGRLVRLAWSNLQTFNGRVEHFHMDGVNKVHRDTIIHNAFITGYRDTNGYYELPFERVVVLRITPQYLKINDAVYESSMNPSRPMEMNPPGLLSRDSFREDTVINRVSWKNSDTGDQDITEIGYEENASLTAEIENPIGSTATITITKKDGSEFENGQKELSFTETISDGSIELTPMEIKAQWEDFKTADVDELVARVSNNGVNKRSATLQITPKPKATLFFRPHSGWAGEYGFDWMRKEDTTIDGDIDYAQNVGEYGRIYATKPNAVFTVQDYDDLEDEYNPTHINNRKDTAGNPIQYYTPWLSIYREPNATTAPQATLELLTEVAVAPDTLYIEFPKKYFEITGAVAHPEDAKLMRYTLDPAMMAVTTAGTYNKTNITLSCIHTLPNDQTLKVWAVKNKADGTPDTPILSGMLTVKANSKAHRRVAKVVFVNVVTDINGSGGIDGISNAGVTLQENYLSPFLKQALIKPEVESVDLDLYDSAKPEVQRLNSEYIIIDRRNNANTNIFSKYSNNGGVNLVTFLTQQFNAIPTNAQYADHYKVFFLGEAGGRRNTQGTIKGLGGYARAINSKECVMFARPRPFFVAHELMHCMGLYHSFDNDGAHTFKIGQTENIMDYSHMSQYATPNGTLTQISTWQWQWPILQHSNENES